MIGKSFVHDDKDIAKDAAVEKVQIQGYSWCSSSEEIEQHEILTIDKNGL